MGTGTRLPYRFAVTRVCWYVVMMPRSPSAISGDKRALIVVAAAANYPQREMVLCHHEISCAGISKSNISILHLSPAYKSVRLLPYIFFVAA